MGLKTLAKTEDNGEISTIECVEVTQTDRYIFYVTFPPDMDIDDADRSTKQLQEMLENWLVSDDKFCVIGSVGDAKLIVERVDDGAKN